MSQLHDKINSYALERGIEFDQTYTLTPTRTGTNPLLSTFARNSTANTVWESTVGPIGGSGSWNFQWSTTVATNSYFRGPASGSTELLGVNDQDWSIGFWIKFNNLPTGTSLVAASLFQMTPASSGIQIWMTGSGHATTPSTLNIATADGSSTGTGTQLTTGTWYYIAARRKSNSYTIYINNSLFLTLGNTGTAASTTWQIGDTTARAFNGSYNFSNYYLAPADTIGVTQIAEIWTAGSALPATNITITETPATATALQVLPTISTSSNNIELPATASALMTEPTIVIVANDHVEITTSILVSATFPSNIIAGGDINVNNVITEVLTASAEIINNVIISTGTDESFSAAEFTASAEFPEPILSRRPMTASATMPNAIASVTPNYYSLVQSKDPVVYVPVGNEFPSWATETKSYGSWTPVSLTRSGTTTTGSLLPMSLVGLGESSDFRNNQENPRIFGSFNQTDIDNLISSRSYTIEYWTYLTGVFKETEDLIATFNMKNLEIDYLGWWYGSLGPGFTNNWQERKTITLKFGNNGPISCPAPSILQRNTWNHIVLKVTPETNPNQQTYYLYANGSLIASGTTTVSFATGSNNVLTWERNVEGDFPSSLAVQPKIDEMAIYDYPLSNSEIIANYNFINTLSPNKTIAAEYFDASTEPIDHNFLVTSNVNYPETPVTASAVIVNPVVIASKVINVSAQPLIASARNTDVTVYWGWTIYETPATAYAERPGTYFLNDVYYQYVQTNIAPYRYVSFDAMDEYFDYGTDNDYSVVPTVVGGSIVNPNLGINGKSAKTAGISYITDGVILKESEWNDSWGTGQNSYHSSFWFQRAVDDNSTTGLRVLWNLNGYKDNQHVVLYQYQNKLHMQFNNGSGTWIEQDTGTLDLFDYQRHFVVIEFDHTNVNNNTVRLYVDSVLKMTVSLGAYTGTTTNASSADSGPNSELNNHPRLSVGCLITPFASTALPVLPTNTKLIIDEVYWDKNAINQTMVTNLYATMPDKNNKIVVADPFTASDEFVMPTFSTSSILTVGTFIASVESVEPIISVVREVVTVADPMTASALSVEGTVFEDRIISADIFVATAIFNTPGVVITIPGGPMLANAVIVKPTLVNGVPISEFTAYVKYLRSQNYYGVTIPRLVEIK